VTRLVGLVRPAQDRTGAPSLLTVCVLCESQAIMRVESSWDGASPEPLAAFAELSRIMLGDGSMNETLGRITALARETVPDADEVPVTLVDHDKAKTVAFTGQDIDGCWQRNQHTFAVVNALDWPTSAEPVTRTNGAVSAA
jgi:hypothetical protein